MIDGLRHHRRAGGVAAGVGLLGLVSVVGLAGDGDASRRPDARATGSAWVAGRLPAAEPATPTLTPPLPATTVTSATITAAPPSSAPHPAPPPIARPAAPRPAAAVRSTAPARQEPRSLAAAWIAAGAQNVAPETAPATPPPSGTPTPVRIEIPAIGVSAPVDRGGLNRDRTMQVPKDFARTNWYTGLPVPGDPGPAVIVGHVDNRKGPAVFYRLRDLGPGDEVRVHRADGTAVVFVVERSKQVPKSAFPTDEVYGPTPDPQLRLVTCGGSFDRSTRHYRDNIIVFLRLKV